MSGIGFTVGTESKRMRVEPELDHPFRIAVMGDFSGRASRGAPAETPLARRRAYFIDRDNFDEVLASLAPSIDFTDAPLHFTELDDFHPDRLYERLPVFRAIRNLRRRLSDPATFAEAAGELLGAAQPEAGSSAPLAPPPADLLEQILGGGSGAAAARPARSRDDFQAYLRQIVSPHLVPGQDPRQPELLAQVDLAATHEMRAILHAPTFQSLESLWRSLFMLTRRLETSAALQIFVIDVTRDELARDLLADDKDLESTGVYKLLVEADPWSVVVGAYTFGLDTDDLVLLGRISGIAKAASAPWLAAAHPRLAGCLSFALHPDPDDWVKQAHGGWQALRELPETRFVGLAAPRFVLRLPYGKNADACELFAFEEMPGEPAHEDYLWGNPAIACAILLGQAFENEGWSMRPGSVIDLDHLPQHLYKLDGQTVSKPCAEIPMSERAASRLLDAGIMPLASIKGSDRARLVRLQSIGYPQTALAGRWAVG